MTAAAETGRAGERAATEYLRRAGYEICALNWRQGRYELDIVACREGVLHTIGNFAVPTNCTIFAGLKKNSLTSGHRARALETENSTP